jgi:hypothetical protein
VRVVNSVRIMLEVKIMTRLLLVFGCVFAFALAAPMGHEAAAKKRKACTATAMDGKQTKWRCKANQKCCYDWFAGKGTCVGASEICF